MGYKSCLWEGTCLGLKILRDSITSPPSRAFSKNFGHHGNNVRRDWLPAESFVGMEGPAAPATLWPSPMLPEKVHCFAAVTWRSNSSHLSVSGWLGASTAFLAPRPQGQGKLGSRAFWHSGLAPSTT